MTEQTVNIPLLRKAVEWAEAEAAKPIELRQWLQQFWEIPPDTSNSLLAAYRKDRAPECGTTYCIAGFICQVEGIDAAGFWGERAAEALGIHYDPFKEGTPADRLFNANNTIADVRRIAESIAGERL